MPGEIISVTHKDFCCPQRKITFTRPPPPPTTGKFEPCMPRMYPMQCQPHCNEHWHDVQFTQQNPTNQQLLYCQRVCSIDCVDKNTTYQTDYANKDVTDTRKVYVASPQGRKVIPVTRMMEDEAPFEVNPPLPSVGRPNPVTFTVVTRIPEMWPPLSEYQEKIGIKAMEILYCMQANKKHHCRKVAQKIVERRIRLIE